jgi:hypothetical protein
VLGDLIRPQRSHHFDALVGTRATLFERHATRRELLARPTDADADIDAAV